MHICAAVGPHGEIGSDHQGAADLRLRHLKPEHAHLADDLRGETGVIRGGAGALALHLLQSSRSGHGQHSFYRGRATHSRDGARGTYA